MAFGTTPLSTTSLGTNQFPVSAVAVPGETGGNLTALEGGPESTDSNGNKTSPVSSYVKDGGDVAQGLTTDAAVTGDTTGTLSAKLRGLNKLLGDVWDSVNHHIKVDGSGVTQPVSATSLPLPTGASTSAKQPALGTAGSASADVLTVQGITSMTALKVDGSGVTQPVSGTFWQATQPVSAASLPLPSGASTSAKQPALGTAGTASSDVITVQGIASMTALKVDGSGVTQPVSGTVTANAGTGTFTNQQSNVQTDYDTGAGTQNMTMFGVALPASGGAVAGGTSSNPLQVSLANTSSNSTAVKVDNSGVTQPVSGTVTIQSNASVNVNQVAGSSVATAGTGIQKVGLTDASGNALNSTSNALNVSQQATGSVSATMQNAVTANGNGSTLATLGMATVAFTVSGTFSATVNFEGTEDNSNWSAIEATAFNATTPATTTTTTGSFVASCAGMQSVRARVSGYASGNVTVTAHAVPVGSAGSGGAGGSGGTSSSFASSFPSTGTAIGASDGTNMQGLQVESSSNKNLRVALYNGATEASVTGSNALKVDGSAVTQPVSGNIGITDGTNIANVLAATSASNATSAQAAQLIAGADKEVTFTTTSAQAVASTDVLNYRWVSVHITSQGTSSTVTFQASNDNSTWVSANLVAVAAASSGPGSSTTSTGIFHGALTARYFRLNVTGISAGTTAGTIEFQTMSSMMSTLNVIATQSGTWSNVQLGASTSNGASDFHLISANTTNASSIKVSAGLLYGYEIYNSNAAVRYVKLYNKASAPTVGSDTPFRTIGVPPSGRAFYHNAVGLTMGTGIALATTTSIADSDSTAVGSNDLSIEIDYR